MRPNTILVQMGNMMVKVPRRYLVDPTESDARTYRLIKGIISMWKVVPANASLVGGWSVTPLHELSVPTKNMQKAFDRFEAEEVECP